MFRRTQSFFKQFCKKQHIPKEERPLIYGLMAEALGTYYKDLYGYDKYGPSPDFLIDERMGEPYIFGYAAIRILHHPQISEATKERVADYTLSIVQPEAEFGVPNGMLVPIAYLASRGRLSGQRLASAIRQLAGDQELFNKIRVRDGEALMDVILADQSLPVQERLDLARFLLIRCEHSFQVGKAMLRRAVAHPALPVEGRQTLCRWLIHGQPGAKEHGIRLLEQGALGQMPFALTPAAFGLVPEYLKRQAILALACLHDDPTAVVKQYLGTGKRYDVIPFDQGAADVIEEFYERMDPQTVRQMVEQGTRATRFEIRKRFYTLGAKLYGPEFVRPALKDNSKRLRDWAQKQLEGK